MKKHNQDILQGPLLPNIILYAIPVMLTTVLQLLFNAADLAIIGRFCGSVYVAAVGSTGAVTGLIVNLFTGLSVGAGVMVAHGLGARESQDVHRTVHTALPTAIVSGLILTVVGIFASGPILQLMGTPDNVLPLSTLYMQIYFLGITFSTVYNYCASILRAAGDTKSPLIYLSIAGVLNVALNVLFVTVFHMNVAGVALATILSQGVSAVLVVIALIRRTDACKLELGKMRFYWPQLCTMLRIGLPAGMQSSLFSISNVLIQSSINSFGDVFMSGNAAAANIEGFLYAVVNAFHQSALNFTGQNVGAGQYKRVYKTLWLCLGCVMVVGSCVGLAAYSFGPSLLSIYIEDSAEAIAYGMIRITFNCLPYCLFGMMEVCAGSLRGMGASFTPMLISILGVCGIRVAWVYLVFPFFHTPEWLYLSYPISWGITFLCHFTAFQFVYRRHTRKALPAQ